MLIKIICAFVILAIVAVAGSYIISLRLLITKLKSQILALKREIDVLKDRLSLIQTK